MKKAVLILAAALSASCIHDVAETVNLDDYADYAETGFKVKAEFDSDLRDLSILNTYDFEDEGENTKATSSNLINVVGGVLSSAMTHTVHQVIGTYTSIGTDGNDLTVSGKIFYPKDGKIKNMMIVSHYTIGSNAECPSESFSFEGIYAAKGYAVVIADYVGFGETVGMVHPYLQARTCSSNVIDMALVARNFLKARGLEPESDEVILLGYSQGGATTMYVQYMLENDEKYVGKFKIKKNYAGSGPYNIAKTYDYCVKVDDTGIPCAIPMIIQGMSLGMPQPLEMSYFFREPLLSNYDEWLNSKKYTVAQISELIGTKKLSKILTPNARDKSKDETARFYKELLENSIPHDYYPKAPLFMFHSEDDQTVPFVNSQILQRDFEFLAEDVEYDFGHYGNHQQGALKFILKVFKMLD